MLRLSLQAVAYGRALVLGLERPVAVPLVQSVEEQARYEAGQLEGARTDGFDLDRPVDHRRHAGDGCAGHARCLCCGPGGVIVGLIWLRWNGFDYDPAKFGKAVEVSAKVAGQVPHSKVSSQALSLIPTFILIGYLAYHAKMTTALFDAAKKWIAWVPGGLAVSTVFATAGFAAVSGASVAIAAVFARIAIPEMLNHGYNKQFAAGVVAAGGTLASLIPPSAILVIYAIIVEQDVGKLLLAGFIPGAFSALVYAILIIGLALVFKNVGPPVGGFTGASGLRPCRRRFRS